LSAVPSAAAAACRCRCASILAAASIIRRRSLSASPSSLFSLCSSCSAATLSAAVRRLSRSASSSALSSRRSCFSVAALATSSEASSSLLVASIVCSLHFVAAHLATTMSLPATSHFLHIRSASEPLSWSAHASSSSRAACLLLVSSATTSSSFYPNMKWSYPKAAPCEVRRLKSCLMMST
jgi:hypothetical protein